MIDIESIFQSTLDTKRKMEREELKIKSDLLDAFLIRLKNRNDTVIKGYVWYECKLMWFDRQYKILYYKISSYYLIWTCWSADNPYDPLLHLHPRFSWPDLLLLQSREEKENFPQVYLVSKNQQLANIKIIGYCQKRSAATRGSKYRRSWNGWW